jgi:alkylhydroperoxidase family enzyme
VAWIREVPLEQATGLLKEQFDSAIRRAGRVYHIVHAMSQNPAALRDNIGLYLTLMYGASPLSRARRELIATVVSVELRCHY